MLKEIAGNERQVAQIIPPHRLAAPKSSLSGEAPLFAENYILNSSALLYNPLEITLNIFIPKYLRFSFTKHPGAYIIA